MSLGPIDTPLSATTPAQEPASVRSGSPAVKQAYGEALDFESVLVNQLCQSLLSSTSLTGDGSTDDGSDGLGAFGALIPSALSSSIMSDGGLGLAAQLLPSFEAQSSTSTEPST